MVFTKRWKICLVCSSSLFDCYIYVFRACNLLLCWTISQIRLTAHAGFGLFTLQDIEPGTYICDYTGEVLCSNELDLRGKATSDHYLYVEDDCMVLWRGFVVLCFNELDQRGKATSDHYLYVEDDVLWWITLSSFTYLLSSPVSCTHVHRKIIALFCWILIYIVHLLFNHFVGISY